MDRLRSVKAIHKSLLNFRTLAAQQARGVYQQVENLS
jgi:hypothetical protein